MHHLKLRFDIMMMTYLSDKGYVDVIKQALTLIKPITTIRLGKLG